MITPDELEFLGKQAADDYVSNNVDLNSSISKFAEDRGLNRQQINRIVEAANTETYIKLASAKTGLEKYVEFDTASSEKIASDLGVAKAINPETDSIFFIDDYKSAPSSRKKEAAIEKVASAEVADPDAKLKIAEKIQKLAAEIQVRAEADNKFNERSEELHALWNQESDNLFYQVKQAALGGTPYAYIDAVMKTASPRKTTTVLSKIFRERFEKTASYYGRVDTDTKEVKRAVINQNHPIVKSLEKLANYENKLNSLQKSAAQNKEASLNNIEEIEKLAGPVNLMKTVVRHKLSVPTVLAAAAIPALTTAGAAAERRKIERENTKPLSPYTYNQVGRTIN